jgi:tetraacyldisaccharide 4'-kinase
MALLEAWFARLWWRPAPTPVAWLLWPLSALYGLLAAVSRLVAGAPQATAVPVIVVGNLVVGGAGKTPLVVALVQALAAAGWRPGVISRGHGRSAGTDEDADEIVAVQATSSPRLAGDEPLLIQRRTGAPVFVGRKRADVARALAAAHPKVDVIVSDDGLQHHALARVAQLIVFDDRGAGNGMLLPAGPLRQPLPRVLPRGSFVVHTGSKASTVLPGTHVPRTATRVLPIAAWRAGDESTARALASLRGRRLVALAGIGAPAQFFAALQAAGLEFEPLPCRDHADYAQAPWSEGTAEVITTEKDAIKLAALPGLDANGIAGTQVWVLPLDCTLPAPLQRELFALLPARPGARAEESR